MVNTPTMSAVPTTPLPIFKGGGYEFWNIRMKTLLISHDLWDTVASGFNEHDNDRPRLKENKKKDAKALSIIQQAIHDEVFSHIVATTTSRQAWTLLQTKYQGDSKVKTVKLQILLREFETLQMKEGEGVADFLSKVMKNVNQKRAYGEEVLDQLVVEKVLRSLPAHWDHVVTAIEESKDLSKLSFDLLMGSLQAHECRVNRKVDQVEEEQAFQAKEDDGRSMSRGRGYNRGRGCGRGRGQGRGRSMIQCYNCNRYGHVRASCWSEPQANAAIEDDDEDEEGQLFMAMGDKDTQLKAIGKESKSSGDIWFLDSGCSNHMMGHRQLFKSLDKVKSNVRMGNGKAIQVEGKGVVKLEVSKGRLKVLHDVQFSSELGYNLLSVGQLMRCGYSLLFDND
ncbi:putative RNA-directed DNA polymerase [Helianthus annuus]|nr:putative RNA-directed DNA polymerase [Helianthus annuus]